MCKTIFDIFHTYSKQNIKSIFTLVMQSLEKAINNIVKENPKLYFKVCIKPF